MTELEAVAFLTQLEAKAAAVAPAGTSQVLAAAGEPSLGGGVVGASGGQQPAAGADEDDEFADME